MIYVQNLTAEEREVLTQHYRKAQCSLIRERAHAILLSSQRRDVSDIALILVRNKNTLRQWINDFNTIRLASIFHKYGFNINAGKLTKEQKEEIKETLSKPPSLSGLPKDFWTVPALKSYLKGEFQVVYESDRSYHYLLRFGGLSFKLPQPFDIKRDKDQINKRLKEIQAQIEPFLADDGWEVFAADETRLTFETEIRRAWLKRNEKTVIKVHRDSQYQNFFGALNLKNHRDYVFQLNWQNQTEIIRALRRLLKHYPKKNLCVIWDNARWHKGKLLRKELSKNGSLKHIHLISFPPYAPDVNPQEQVWQYGKNNVSNDRLPESFKRTINLFKKSIRTKFLDYKIPEFVLR